MWLRQRKLPPRDPNVIYPSERERAAEGARDYRVFYGPGQTRHPHLSWILVVREVGADEGRRLETHIHHGAYRTDYEAKRAAVQWGAPPE